MTSLTLQISKDSMLVVEDMKQLGECGEACKTIEKAAQEVMDGHDIEVAEALYMVRFLLYFLVSQSNAKRASFFIKINFSSTASYEYCQQHNENQAQNKNKNQTHNPHHFLLQKKFKDGDTFQKWMCYDSLSKVCSRKQMRLPSQNHKPYPPLVARNPDDQNVEKIMGEMEDNGLRGKIWSREELMQRYLNEVVEGEL